MVAILGDMKIHDRDSQTPELHGHARVYWDGQIIYENEKVWDYKSVYPDTAGTPGRRGLTSGRGRGMATVRAV